MSSQAEYYLEEYRIAVTQLRELHDHPERYGVDHDGVVDGLRVVRDKAWDRHVAAC